MSPADNNSDIAAWRDWIGRTETATDLIAPVPVAALNATLDRDDPAPRPGDPLPPLYHWLYFLPLARTADLDADGHARRGGFLPPVTLPRRMWAASEVAFPGTLRIGEEAERTSVIEDVAEKTGRTGPLVFVTVRHELRGAEGLAVTDRQTIVYREAPPPGRPPVPPGRPAPADAAFGRTVTPDEAMLFRYSALIFNAHRIHYDLPYTTREEGYPGLVVHGPLTATLLADLARREWPDRPLARFTFRALKPLFAHAPIALSGRAEDGTDGALALWAASAGGDLAVSAEAALA